MLVCHRFNIRDDASSDDNMLPLGKRCCFVKRHASSWEKMLLRKATCVLVGKDAASGSNMRPRGKRCCFVKRHASSWEKMLLQKSTCCLTKWAC